LGDEVQSKELYCLQTINDDFLSLNPSQTTNQTIGFSSFQFVLKIIRVCNWFLKNEGPQQALNPHTLQIISLGTGVGGVRQAIALVQRKGDDRQPQ